MFTGTKVPRVVFPPCSKETRIPNLPSKCFELVSQPTGGEGWQIHPSCIWHVPNINLYRVLERNRVIGRVRQVVEADHICYWSLTGRLYGEEGNRAAAFLYAVAEVIWEREKTNPPSLID